MQGQLANWLDFFYSSRRTHRLFNVAISKGMPGVPQVTLIVSNDNPRMDIEEASLSFRRSRPSRGMPTLRNFIPINHWERVVEFFRSAKDGALFQSMKKVACGN